MPFLFVKERQRIILTNSHTIPPFPCSRIDGTKQLVIGDCFRVKIIVPWLPFLTGISLHQCFPHFRLSCAREPHDKHRVANLKQFLQLNAL